MEGYVDAIEDGRLVRVREDYAKREGLFVLRKVGEVTEEKKVETGKPAHKIREEKESEKLFRVDDFRKPLKWKENNILSELLLNFNWELSKQRKIRNLTRKQVSEKVGISEYDLKRLEMGILPSNDFVQISKLEKFYGINLRKNSNFSASSGSARGQIETKRESGDVDLFDAK